MQAAFFFFYWWSHRKIVINGAERYWGGACGENLDLVSAPFWLCRSLDSGVAALPVSRKVKSWEVVVSPLELLSPASTNNEGRESQGVTSGGSDGRFPSALVKT